MKTRSDENQTGRITKKMWMEISESLKLKGYNFTWGQVKGIWKTLILALKRAKDNNNKVRIS
jgi:hypothetical protein